MTDMQHVTVHQPKRKKQTSWLDSPITLGVMLVICLLIAGIK